MDRISTATKAVDLFGAGKHGFKDGNLGLGIVPTDFNAAWFNDIQEELIGIIESAGLTPTAGTRTQVAQAIQAMIAATVAQDYKTSVRAATTANIAALAGGTPNTLDGVALAANDRILVKDQTTGSQNGIYYVSTLGTGANGTWTRATDADQAGELTRGAIVAVEEGSTNADSQWMLTTDGTITIGTTSLTFAIRGNSTVKQIQSITSSVAGNQLTVGLNPTTLDFRSATLTTGVPNTRTIGAALSLVVPASATLGTASATQARLALLAIDNAGTVELAIVNLAGGNNLDETTLISTTAISAAATAANVIYSTTARSNVPFRVVGFLDITEATAGTWATDATTKQGMGGQALAAMQSIGFGQTWQSVTRATGTTYYNTTGKPIFVSIQGTYSSGAATIWTINGIAGICYQSNAGANPQSNSVEILIPVGASYSLNISAGTFTSLVSFELR